MVRCFLPLLSGESDDTLKGGRTRYRVIYVDQCEMLSFSKVSLEWIVMTSSVE